MVLKSSFGLLSRAAQAWSAPAVASPLGQLRRYSPQAHASLSADAAIQLPAGIVIPEVKGRIHSTESFSAVDGPGMYGWQGARCCMKFGNLPMFSRNLLSLPLLVLLLHPRHQVPGVSAGLCYALPLLCKS